MKIIVNPKWTPDLVKQHREAIEKKNGHCPCMVQENEDTKCICKLFRTMDSTGPCLCGYYVKVAD